jgi:competence protein ComEA
MSEPSTFPRSSRHADAPPRPVVPGPGPAEWLAALRDRFGGHAVKGAAVVLVVVAGLVAYAVGVSGGQVGGGRDAPPRAVASTTATASGAPSTGIILVHVAGAVVHPGVVELRPGARVIDAVESAGGALPSADLDRLNLAAKVADGERVLVQKVGDPPVADGGAVTGGASGTSGLVNLNTATAAQLDTLPGIGPTLAEAIISERQRRGGFRSVNELRDVRGIGEKRFADLRTRVTV